MPDAVRLLSDGSAEALDAPAGCRAGLDPTFGQQGQSQLSSGAPAVMHVFARADGRLVAVGDVSTGSSGGHLQTQCAALQLSADEQADPTFGMGGTAVVPVLPDGPCDVRGGALETDGKLVVASKLNPTDGEAQWLVARLNEDGSLDGEFGAGGITAAPVEHAAPASVATLADGSALVAGTVEFPLDDYCCDGNVIVAKYDPHGALDAAFGAGGVVRTSVGVASGDDYASAILWQPDGRFVVAGYAYAAASDGGVPTPEAMVVRYTAAGALDSSFGDGGVVLVENFGRADALAPGSDGKLLVTLSNRGASEAVVARYTAAGSLDATFGSGGLAQVTITPGALPAGGVLASALFSLPDGSILLAGSADAQTTFLAKLTPAGAAGATFGDGGVIKTGLVWGAATVTADGKAVIAGTRPVDAGGAEILERYCL